MGRKRAGRWARAKVRKEQRDLLRRNWQMYAKLGGLWLAMLAVVVPVFLATRMPAGFVGFFLGVWLTSLIGGIYYSFSLRGLHYRSAGADAETWTSGLLRRLPGWQVIDHVPFEKFDVDHVAIGPNRILAVETKWTKQPLKITSRGIEGDVPDFVGMAKARARSLKKLLTSHGHTTEVLPVLVLWGPGVPHVDGGRIVVRKVRVLIGTQFKQWRGPYRKRVWRARMTSGARDIIEAHIAAAEASEGRTEAVNSSVGRPAESDESAAAGSTPAHSSPTPRSSAWSG